MSWIWTLGKRIGKYLFRGITTCACFWKYWKYTPLHSVVPSALRRRTSSMNPNEVNLPKDHDSFLRVPTRFVGEIHLVLSSLIIISCLGSLVNLSLRLKSTESPDELLFERGFLVFTIVTLITSLMDIGLSFVLIAAANQNNLNKALFWYRSTLTLLITFSLLTVGFGVLVKSGLVVLGLLPSLIYKPFALWIVSGFIEHIYESIRKSVPQPILPVEITIPNYDTCDSTSTVGASRDLVRQQSTQTTTTSIGSTTTTNGEVYDPDEMKRKTTVFVLNKNRGQGVSNIPGGREYVTLTRVKSLPN